MVSADHWLSNIKINRLSWYLTLVSADQASSNSAQTFAPGVTLYMDLCSFVQDLLERETKNQEKYEKEKGRLVKFTEVGVCLTSNLKNS